MPRNRFLPGTRFQILNEKNAWIWHEINQVLINDSFSIVNITEGGAFIETHAHLMDVFLQEKLRFETKGKSAHKQPNEQLSFEHEYGDFNVVPEKRRAEALRRYEIIIPILRLGESVSNNYLDNYVEDLKKDPKYKLSLNSAGNKRRKGKKMGTALSRSSIRLWISDYKQSGYSVHGLYPYHKSANSQPSHRLEDEVDKAIDGVLAKYNIDRDSTPPNFNVIDDITTDVTLEIDNINNSQPVGQKLSYPHPNTIRNRIKEYGMENLLQSRKKRGQAVDVYEGVQEGERATRVNEIHEYDGTQLNLIAIDEGDGYPVGRVSFMGGIDDLTGYPTGWRLSFEPVSSKLVADTMISSILPKPDFISMYGTQHNCEAYGLPGIAKYDNGNEWLNQSEINACGENGIIFLQCPTHSPELKGGIERYIRTKGEGLIQTVPGATFNYMFNTRDYNPVDYSCIGLSNLSLLTHHYVLDQYTQTWQDARKGTPASLWRESISKGFLPCLPDSVQSLRISFFRSATRKLQRYGIEIDTIIYQASDTSRLRSLLKRDELDVLVKINPYDISYIYVLDPITQREWLPFYANNQEYTQGLSIWKHNVIREYTLQKMGLEVNIINLCKSKKHVHEVIQREYQRVKSLQKGRRKAAAYLYEKDPNSFIRLGSTEKKSEETVLLPHTHIYDYSYTDKEEAETPPPPSSSPSIDTTKSTQLPSPAQPVTDSGDTQTRDPEPPLDDDDLESWGGGYKNWAPKNK